MCSRPLIIAMLLVASITTATPSAAERDGDARCRSAKLRATAKYSREILVCSSKAAKAGVTTDQVCLDAATSKLSTRFTKADGLAGGSCRMEHRVGRGRLEHDLPTAGRPKTNVTKRD